MTVCLLECLRFDYRHILHRNLLAWYGFWINLWFCFRSAICTGKRPRLFGECLLWIPGSHTLDRMQVNSKTHNKTIGTGVTQRAVRKVPNHRQDIYRTQYWIIEISSTRNGLVSTEESLISTGEKGLIHSFKNLCPPNKLHNTSAPKFSGIFPA